MEDVEALVAAAIAPERRMAPAVRMSYAGAFREHAGVDPFDAPTSCTASSQ